MNKIIYIRYIKIFLSFNLIYQNSMLCMNKTELEIKGRFNLNTNNGITQINTLQALLIRAKRQNSSENTDMVLYVSFLAKLYAQEGKIDDFCNPESCPVVRYTALQLSAFYGFADIFKILLAYGADPDIAWKDIRFNKNTQTINTHSYTLKDLIRHKNPGYSIQSIHPDSAESMLTALSIRKRSPFWSDKTPEERSKLLEIKLPR